jgi:hypothetical protein
MDFQPLFERQTHPGIVAAARYFQEIAAGDAVPKRQDFRPNKVRSILGYIFLLDVLPDLHDYRFSLCGVNVSVLFGMDGTNARLSELHSPELAQRLKATYDNVIASRTFLYIRGQYSWPDRSVNIERLLVPMTGPDGQLNAIFGVAIPDCPADMLVIYAGVGVAKLVIDEQIMGTGHTR